MELRDMLIALREQHKVFFSVVGIFIVGGVIFWSFQRTSFRVEITMNVARSGVQETLDYAYDDFYRLQADERFADTVVRWLESPRILSDVSRESGVSEGDISFSAGRLSSQIIRVRFFAPNENAAHRITESMFDVLNRETASLNIGVNPSGWFALVGEDPSISDARISLTTILLFCGLLGVSVAFFAVLFLWYVGDEFFTRFWRGRQKP